MGFTRYPIETGAIEFLDNAVKNEWYSQRVSEFGMNLKDTFIMMLSAHAVYTASVRAFGYYAPTQQELLECKTLCEELGRLIRHNMSYRVALEECGNMFYAASL